MLVEDLIGNEMSVYMISELTISDPQEYSKYQDQFIGVFEKFDGKLLSVDDSPIVISGDWTASRSVLAEFPSMKAFKEWVMSEEYQNISKHREAASTAKTILVKSL